MSKLDNGLCPVPPARIPLATPIDPALREAVLRACAAATDVWYPSHYAATQNSSVEELYGPLNDLRLAKLVELTEWQVGQGQGYRITPLGKEVLNDPAYLEQLRVGPPPKEEPIPFNLRATPAVNRFEQGEVAREAYYQPQSAPVVHALIGINVVLFIASVALAMQRGVGFGPALTGRDVATLGRLGAINVPDLLEGQWWRLVVCCFLHHGLIYLTLNMTSLYMLRRVETLWGSGRFLVLYLICGLAGSCLGIYVSPGEPSHIAYLAGASGAIWGLMGSEVAWLLINRPHLPPEQIAQRMRLLSYTLLLNIGVSMLPHVSAAAHVGGGVVGFMAALLLQIHRYGTPSKRSLAGVQLALVPTLIMLALSAALDHDERFKPFKEARQAEQEAVLATEFRTTWREPLQELATQFKEAEARAEKLYLQAVADRPAAEVQKLTVDLEAVHQRTKEMLKQLDEASVVPTATKTKEALRSYAQATGAYTEALLRRARTEQNDTVREARAQWQKAGQACMAEMDVVFK